MRIFHCERLSHKIYKNTIVYLKVLKSFEKIVLKFAIYARLKKAYALCQTLQAMSVLPCRLALLYHADAFWQIAYAFFRLVYV